MENNTNGNSQIYIGMLKKLERKVDRLEILLVELLNKDNPKRYKVSENNLIAHPPSRKNIPQPPERTLFNDPYGDLPF